MELKKIIHTMNELKKMAFAMEIQQHNICETNEFMECFYSLANAGIAHYEAYIAIEDIHKEKYGKNKYKNYESFRIVKSKWTKRNKS